MITIPAPSPYKLDVALANAGYSVHQHLENGVLSWVYDTTQETAIQAFINSYDPIKLAFPDIEQVVSDLIDAKAVAKGYKDAAGCVSYLNSGNATWKADAASLSSWRDACWTQVFALEASVTSGTTPLPSVEQVVAGLPPAPW